MADRRQHVTKIGTFLSTTTSGWCYSQKLSVLGLQLAIPIVNSFSCVERGTLGSILLMCDWDFGIMLDAFSGGDDVC